ncbi:MAG: hypothetical protein QOD92_437 [Acidimicrobiaceae bacterium]
MTISDANAAVEEERVWPQHQAALTLLQDRIAQPGGEEIHWLDLACGRGQILRSLNEQLSDVARARIHYVGYDISNSYGMETKRSAEQLGLASVRVEIGDLSNFDALLPSEERFEFLTITNAAHELNARALAPLLVGAIARLTSDGSMYAYDLEELHPPELGALPWERDAVALLLDRALGGLGESGYRPEVGRWRHKSTAGWSFALKRVHIDVSDAELGDHRSQAEAEVVDGIDEMLTTRLKSCAAALEGLTRYGASTSEEVRVRDKLLYEYWALHRAIGETQ